MEITLTEWYHYVILLFWLIILAIGVSNYPAIEKYFIIKKGFNNQQLGKTLLIISFLLGLFMVLGKVIQPADLDETAANTWDNVLYILAGIFLLLVGYNIFISFTNYIGKSRIIRSIIQTIILIIYFYSGMLSADMLLFTLAIIIIIYFFIKFKHILTIK